MEENNGGKKAEDGFSTWSEAVASARDRTVCMRHVNPSIPEESQD